MVGSDYINASFVDVSDLLLLLVFFFVVVAVVMFNGATSLAL